MPSTSHQASSLWRGHVSDQVYVEPHRLILSGRAPISERAIRVELVGIDRDAYRTMFSVDDETLEKGGDGILASKGDLGELLFSANAGLVDLSCKLFDLKREADRLSKALRLFGEMAEVGQVIYLTHHQHLCEIACNV